MIPVRGVLQEARVPQELGTPVYIDSSSPAWCPSCCRNTSVEQNLQLLSSFVYFFSPEASIIGVTCFPSFDVGLMPSAPPNRIVPFVNRFLMLPCVFVCVGRYPPAAALLVRRQVVPVLNTTSASSTSASGAWRVATFPYYGPLMGFGPGWVRPRCACACRSLDSFVAHNVLAGHSLIAFLKPLWFAKPVTCPAGGLALIPLPPHPANLTATRKMDPRS